MDTVPIATGMLVERHRIDPGTGRALLERVAREHGIDLSTLAAALIALLAPAEPSSHPAADPPTGVQIPMRSRPSGVAAPGHELAAGHPPAHRGPAAIGHRDGRAAAQLVCDLTGAHPDATVIFSVSEDSALRLVGSVGTPEDVLSAWRRVPLVLEIPLCASVRHRRAVFLESGAEMEREYPATQGSREGTEAWASIPISEDGRVTGVVGLSWRAPLALDEATRGDIIRVVEGAGQVILSSLSSAAAELGTLIELLDLIPDSWVVLTPEGTPDGEVLLVEAVSPSLPEAWLGAGLLDLFPILAPSSDLLSDLQQVLRSGAPLVRRINTTRPGGPPWEEPGVEVRIVRTGRRVVITWR